MNIWQLLIHELEMFHFLEACFRLLKLGQKMVTLNRNPMKLLIYSHNMAPSCFMSHCHVSVSPPKNPPKINYLFSTIHFLDLPQINPCEMKLQQLEMFIILLQQKRLNGAFSPVNELCLFINLIWFLPFTQFCCWSGFLWKQRDQWWGVPADLLALQCQSHIGWH